MATDASRYTPAHDLEILRPKRSRHVVVVPVLDEGARLTHQLERMRTVLDLVDVVIADGPSTDGSTDAARLVAAGVHAVTRPHARGTGVSGALQTGFAYALDAGYEGIVMMDGNDKDDPAAMPLFIEKLEAGYDYVQSSRYMAGGRALNTPWQRALIIRLFHAPVFSLLAGHWFTDTTNGWRAFSRRVLEDPRIRVFRRGYLAYDLVYYMSWAACRSGYRVAQVPVTRGYPSSGPLPTKVKFPQGYWMMLRPLLMLLLRRW